MPFYNSGVTELIASIEELAQVPSDVLDKMLHAQADVVEPAIKKKGLAYGVHRTGVTLASIKRGRPYDHGAGRAMTVAPRGNNARGDRNAEVAFINEYGRRSGKNKKGVYQGEQKARPFFRDATEDSADEAVNAAADVYDAWLKNL